MSGHFMFGLHGFKYLTSGGALPSSHYNCLLVTSEITLTAITYDEGYNGDAALATAVLPPGYYPMLFKTASVSAGTALAYLSNALPEPS